MLTLPPGARLLLATSRVDGRKGINGLSTLVRSQFLIDPLSGTLSPDQEDAIRVEFWGVGAWPLSTRTLSLLFG